MKTKATKPIDRRNLYFWLIEEEIQRGRVNTHRRKLAAMRREVREFLKKGGRK